MLVNSTTLQNHHTRTEGFLDIEFGQPDKIVKSLVPEWNSFVFFEVTPASFHQVMSKIWQDALLKMCPNTKKDPFGSRPQVLSRIHMTNCM
jgi:hypothetical protein